ncbi:Peptide methionine sulfoxide reductase B2, chloroplastic [Linum perenne]
MRSITLTNMLKASPIASSANTFLSHSAIIPKPPLFTIFTHSRSLQSNPASRFLPVSSSGKSSSFVSKRSFRLGRIVAMSAPGSVQKSDEEWRAVLSPEQFRILRQKGTEYPGTGQYDKFYEEGVYSCAGCGAALYKSTTKFNSGCGWPAFFDGIPGAINRNYLNMVSASQADPDGRRIEITCASCGGHLGHVFKGEGFKTPTDERHCVNSVSLKFAPGNSSM